MDSGPGDGRAPDAPPRGTPGHSLDCSINRPGRASPGREIIFLATANVDLGLEAVEWTRAWIQSNGDQVLREAKAR